MLADSDKPGCCTQPKVVATTCVIASASSAAASSQIHAPPEKRGSTSAATCTARRVLPTPPVPASVTSRASSSSVGDACDVGVAADERGHLHRQVPGERVERRATAGTSRSSSGWRTWKIRSRPAEVARARARRDPASSMCVVGEELLRSRATPRPGRRGRRVITRAARFTGGAVVVAVAQLGRRRSGSPCARAAVRAAATPPHPNATCAATAASTAAAAVAEHGVEAVTGGLHDDAVGADDGVAHELVVARQRARASRPDAHATGASTLRDR